MTCRTSRRWRSGRPRPGERAAGAPRPISDGLAAQVRHRGDLPLEPSRAAPTAKTSGQRLAGGCRSTRPARRGRRPSPSRCGRIVPRSSSVSTSGFQPRRGDRRRPAAVRRPVEVGRVDVGGRRARAAARARSSSAQKSAWCGRHPVPGHLPRRRARRRRTSPAPPRRAPRHRSLAEARTESTTSRQSPPSATVASTSARTLRHQGVQRASPGCERVVHAARVAAVGRAAAGRAARRREPGHRRRRRGAPRRRRPS